jgi:hypothetical protein
MPDESDLLLSQEGRKLFDSWHFSELPQYPDEALCSDIKACVKAVLQDINFGLFQALEGSSERFKFLLLVLNVFSCCRNPQLVELIGLHALDMVLPFLLDARHNLLELLSHPSNVLIDIPENVPIEIFIDPRTVFHVLVHRIVVDVLDLSELPFQLHEIQLGLR